MVENERCLITRGSVFSGDLALRAGIKLESSAVSFSIDDVVTNSDCGNDDDNCGSVMTDNGESCKDTFARCLGGLCAASRLLFGRIVRMLFTFDVMGSI